MKIKAMFVGGEVPLDQVGPLQATLYEIGAKNMVCHPVSNEPGLAKPKKTGRPAGTKNGAGYVPGKGTAADLVLTAIKAYPKGSVVTRNNIIENSGVERNSLGTPMTALLKHGLVVRVGTAQYKLS